MTGKHFLFALRNLKKNLLYTILVMAGLALGITTFLSTIQWSTWHLTFDRDYPEKDLIFRLTFEERSENFFRHTARILHGETLHDLIFSDLPADVQTVGRLAPFRQAACIVGENSYYENYAFECDPAFLEIFQPVILHGQVENPLDEPYTAVLTRSAAIKFFGSENPVGESFELMHQFDYEPHVYRITSVIEDFPENSHFRISLLTSFEDPYEYRGTAWTYLKLQESADPGEIESMIGESLEESLDADEDGTIFPRLQPLTGIHLNSHKAREIQPNVRFRTVLVLMITGMLVFLLSWFNFTLLSYSQTLLRIRKLVIQWQMGASKQILFRQYLTEQLLIGGMALVSGIILTLLLRHTIERLAGAFMFRDTSIFLFSIAVLVLITLASSLLSSILSTSRLYRHLQLRHLSAGTGTPPKATGKSLFIRSVIVLEFMITFVLISNLLMISRQTSFARSSQLGSRFRDVIHLPNLHRSVIDRYEIFRSRMLEDPAVAEVTASMEEPTGEAMDANTFEINGIDEGEKQLFLFPVDEEFIRFYNLRMIHGSDFPTVYNPGDSAEFFVLNETAARMISDRPEELIGSELTLHFSYPGFIWPGPVTGIVEDFHLSGLDYGISPMVIFPKYTWLYCFSVKPSGDPAPALEHLESVWKELFPAFPLEYYFSSSLIEQLYSPELAQIRILSLFSFLSMIIAGMGLFALSGFFMQKKTRAAALRKINGAKVHQLMLPELRYYLWLALLSALISVPASLFLIERWMRNFKYRSDLPVWIFPLCALILVVFCWSAVFYHTWRLARINPIEFIRDE